MASITNYVMLLNIDHACTVHFLLEGKLSSGLSVEIVCLWMESFERKTCDALREYLRNHKLPTSGKKDVLLAR